MYGVAIVDNQSTSSWVDEEVYEILGMDDRFIHTENYTLSTMERANAKHWGRTISGLEVAPYIDKPYTPPTFLSIPKCFEGKLPTVEGGSLL